MTLEEDFTITPSPTSGSRSGEERKPGSHWTNEYGTGFKNPWSSAVFPGAWPMAKFIYALNRSSDPLEKQGKTLIPFTTPNYGKGLSDAQLKATWLGHACAFVEFPSISTSTSISAETKNNNRGVRALFDPVLGKGMAYAGMGPSRYSEAPCKIEDLPEIDMIAISHNHYDHLDLPTLKSIYSAQRDKFNREPPIFLPLNTGHILSGIGINKTSMVEMDWWEEKILEVKGRGKVKVICTPTQHQTGRGAFDKDKSLWCSWVVQDISSSESKSDVKGNKGASIWFAGDTGYCSMHEESHSLAASQSVDACPAFKEIGEKYGPITLGFIPIGAYYPRKVMSFCHAAPIESVRMFQDTKCQNAMAIHWGTFRMTAESIIEPPEKLAEAKKEVGVDDNKFITVAIGESKGYDV